MNTSSHPSFPTYIHMLFIEALCRQREVEERTDSHHVVPAIQQAHAELQAVRGVAHVNQRRLPVWILTDGRCPSHEEPTHNEQDDGQQAQHSPAGHVGDSLGCTGQEHLQHPAERKSKGIPKNLSHCE